MTSKQTIIIKDKKYDSHSNYLQLVENANGIEKDLFSFLQDWYSSSDSIDIRSSGSTARSRIIRLSKKAMVSSAEATCQFFGIGSNEVLHLCVPVQYIAGKMMLVRALVSGASLIFEEPSAAPLLDCSQQISFSAMTPMQVTGVLNNHPERFQHLAQLIIGGAPVLQALKVRLQLINTSCYATFGMTETATHVALNRLNGDSNSDVYSAVGDVLFKVDDRGCLIVQSKKREINNLSTNEIVELQDKSSFRWLGRADYVINTGGLKVYPEAIEEKLSSEFSSNYFIASLPDSQFGEKVILLVEGEPQNISFDSLDKYEQPKQVYFIKNFVYTETGKIQRIKTLAQLINA